ncbi:SIS domain-containing protein [Aliamphritea hakodatensis]|uniref:SIS domain-containing protein n=1 Tax=Aliamphritea hakodatensis TaxID=2895352 RepID=UPI0022FD5241|nr:SIS domain-containing protein [Aliamphritea hakodatensis]
MNEHITASLHEAREGLENLINSPDTLQKIATGADWIVSSVRNGGRVFSCGNGGSMCDAMHFAEELTGRYRNTRKGVAAVAISDPSHISCVANDFGYDYIFSRYLESHGNPKDLLIALSTSGSSKNIIKAVEAARNEGIRSIVLTGKPDSALQSMADLCICTPAGNYADRVQELHIKVLHIFIELTERTLFPENY